MTLFVEFCSILCVRQAPAQTTRRGGGGVKIRPLFNYLLPRYVYVTCTIYKYIGKPHVFCVVVIIQHMPLSNTRN
jgi:hypothetical protein